MSDVRVEVFEEDGIRIEINSTYLLDDLRLAFDKYITALEAQLTKSIGREQFSWPQPTRRRTGEVVQSPRDIVDSGFFRSSISLSRPDEDSAVFVWNAPYSRYILKGYSTKNANWPARDWIAKALEVLPPEPNIKKNLRNV